MQQFTVPQNIDIEAKIIGPISARQFILMLVGVLFGFLFYKIADFGLFVLIALADLAVIGTFAFFRVNGVAFHYFLLNVIQTVKRPSVRVWATAVSLAEIRADLKKKPEEKKEEVVPTKRLEAAPLAQISLIVDTGGAYRGEK